MALQFPKAATIDCLSNKRELAVCLGPLKLKLEEVQSRLNHCGLTSLIVKLITSTQHDTVMLETVKLAVALLKGGHREVQVRKEEREEKEREREREREREADRQTERVWEGAWKEEEREKKNEGNERTCLTCTLYMYDYIHMQ